MESSDEEVESPLVPEERKGHEESEQSLVHAVQVDLEAESKDVEEEYIEVKAVFADEETPSPMFRKHAGVIAVPIEPMEVERLVPLSRESERRRQTILVRPPQPSRQSLTLRLARCSANASFVFVTSMLLVTVMRVMLLQFLQQEAEIVCGDILQDFKLNSGIELGRDLAGWVTVKQHFSQSLESYDPDMLPPELRPYRGEAMTRLLSAARIVEAYEQRSQIVASEEPRFLYTLALFGDVLSEEAAACLAYGEDSWEALVPVDVGETQKTSIFGAVWIDFIPGSSGPLDWARSIQDMSQFLRSRYGDSLAQPVEPLPPAAAAASGVWFQGDADDSVRLAEASEVSCLGRQMPLSDLPTLYVSQPTSGHFFSIPIVTLSADTERCVDHTVETPEGTLVMPPMGDYVFCRTLGHLVFDRMGGQETICQWYSQGTLQISSLGAGCITVHDNDGVVRIENGCSGHSEEGFKQSPWSRPWTERRLR